MAKQKKIDWSKSIKIEHEVQRIISQQEMNGWYFNKEKAQEYVDYLQNERDKIYTEIRPLLKMEVISRWTEVKKPFTQSGEYISRVSKHFGSDVDQVAAPLSFVEFEEPDINKRNKLMRQLTLLGWKPLEFTDKGNPRLTEESMECLEGDTGLLIARWYIYKHRQSQIEGWLKKVRPDHRISAQANTCGTPTGRLRHSVVVNVPKASDKVIFGHEMRSLFTVPKGKVLIGHDASGLEARMLAHYLNDAELTKEIIHGDFHSKVWEPIKEWVASRDNAKNIEYALIYGAGDAKLGRMSDYKPKKMSDTKMGGIIREAIMKGLPALGELTKNVQDESDKGYLIGLDGRKLLIRSKHSALNTLFQGAGAIVMKVSMILLDKWVRENELDALKVGDFHDEGQAEVENNQKTIELYSSFAVQSIIKAGEYFNLNCPLDAEAKVGDTWAETH